MIWTDDETIEALDADNLIALLVGRTFLRIIGLLSVAGWASPAGALPYLHRSGELSDIAIDFIEADSGKGPEVSEARARLLAISPEWYELRDLEKMAQETSR